MFPLVGLGVLETLIELPKSVKQLVGLRFCRVLGGRETSSASMRFGTIVGCSRLAQGNPSEVTPGKDTARLPTIVTHWDK